MKLSVITVNFNNAVGLRRTIESVIVQSFTDYEYIVIDGGSDDGSVETIKECECEISYWCSEKDDGIFQAMNKGIGKAKGEYLLFLNSGDFLVDKDVLSGVFREECSADILCAKCNVLKDGKVVWTSNPPGFVTFGTLYNTGLNHQSTFIKRELFERIGIYREDFKYNADIDFWYKAIILGGATTQKIDVVTTNYSLGGLSDRSKNDAQFLKEHKVILSNPIFSKIIPDYERWKRDASFYREYGWINSHPFIRKVLGVIHKCSGRLQ